MSVYNFLISELNWDVEGVRSLFHILRSQYCGVPAFKLRYRLTVVVTNVMPKQHQPILSPTFTVNLYVFINCVYL